MEAENHVIEKELHRATPTIQAAVADIRGDNWYPYITNICGSFAGFNVIEHEACAAIDVTKDGIGDNETAKKYLESLDLVCESHFNYSGLEAPIDSPNSHFHCVDKWWLEEYRFKKENQVSKVETDDSVGEILTQAYFISGGDKDFIRLLIAENGEVSHTRVGVTDDLGLCQVSPVYHPEITNDPRFFSDWKWQLSQCYKLYVEGTTFWGFERIKNEAGYKEKVDALIIYS